MLPQRCRWLVRCLVWTEVSFLPNFHMKRKIKGAQRSGTISRNSKSSLNKYSSIAGSRPRSSANFWPPNNDCGPRIFGLRARHCRQCYAYRLCGKQKIMVEAGCTRSGRYPDLKFSVYDSFFQNFAKLSEPSRELCKIFWVLAKGFKWRHGKVTTGIPFGLRRFGIVLQTPSFPGLL